MKKNLKFFAGAILGALALTGCSSEPNYPEVSEEIAEQLQIVTDDENKVYGNIRLVDEVEGGTVTWKVDKASKNFVSTEDVNEMKKGAITRQDEDVDVTLKATVELEDGKYSYEQTITLAAAPEELTDDDYEAYLFGHFVGEGYGKEVKGEKVATGEQMFFALADVGQGLKFKDMNKSTMSNLKPVLSSNVGERGVRDPYICRSPEGDSFYLIATDLSVYTRGGWGNNAGQATKTGSHSIVIWESHDLVNWTEARLIEVAAENAGMAWAPEMTYCEETGEYLIFFSSTILDDYSKGVNAKILKRDSVYYTTTRDFVHFTETKQFIDNQPYPKGYTNKEETDQYATNNDERKIIDGSVMKIGDWYYSAAKDGGNNENHGGILIQKTQDLYDSESWEKVMNLADTGFKVQGNNDPTNKCLEGPEWFYLNKADRQDPDTMEIGLMADYYANTSVGYIPFGTTDVEDKTAWRALTSGTDYSFAGQTKRHGTILRITAEEAERLKEAYPIK